MEQFIEILQLNQIMIAITIILFSLDFISGLTKAIYNKKFSSEKFRQTIPKFISYIVMLAICFCLDIAFQSNALVKMGCVFIIITESTSIIENLNEFIEIPKFLIYFLESKQEDDEDDV